MYRVENKNNKAYYRCRCDCGNEKDVSSSSLLAGNTHSCGCLISEAVIKRCTTHNKRHTRLYSIHRSMIDRCYDPKSNRYQNYGKRNIQICDEWLNKKDGFVNFYNWSMSHGYQDNLSIDRINSDGNYEPSNCRWSTAKEQGRNKTNTLRYTYAGVTKPVIEWSELLGINYATLRWRIKNNYKLKETFSNLEWE